MHFDSLILKIKILERRFCLFITTITNLFFEWSLSKIHQYNNYVFGNTKIVITIFYCSSYLIIVNVIVC